MSPARQSAGIKGVGGRAIGGQFKAHEASEPGFSLEGLKPHQPVPAPNPKPYFEWSERSDDEFQAAEKRIRDRAQAKAAASFMEAYPDVVAARFVDIGSKDLVGPNGTTWPNPDYEAQSDVPSYMRRRFELRDVLLADGTVADANNPPRFAGNRRAEHVDEIADFASYANAEFDTEPDPYEHNPYEEELYKDHVNNQHTWFHQLAAAGTPRPLDVDKWGNYIDTDKRQVAEWVTQDEIASMGGKTSKTALQAHADELIAKHGKEGALDVLRQDRLKYPTSGRTHAVVSVIADSADRPLLAGSWNPFRRRR